MEKAISTRGKMISLLISVVGVVMFGDNNVTDIFLKVRPPLKKERE